MLKERQKEIMALLKEKGKVSVDEFSLNEIQIVDDVTILSYDTGNTSGWCIIKQLRIRPQIRFYGFNGSVITFPFLAIRL